MTQVSYGTITITDTNDIESIYMVYRGAESDTTPPTLDWNSINNNQWKTDITQVTGTYIWQVTVITKSGVTIDSSNWTQFYGDPVCITGPQGIQGPQGGTGPTGKGVKSVVTYYYLSTSSSSVTGGSWSTTPQDYPSTGTKYYWTKTITTYTDDTTYESTAVYNRALTNSVKDARDANSTAQAADGKATQALTDAGTALSTANSASALATGINQHFWSLAEDTSTTGGTLAAGQYITDILQSNFKQNPNSSGNLLLRSDGIYLKMGLSVLASFTSTALTFNNPSTGNAQLVIGANGTLQSGNYSRGSDTKFASAGTKIDLTAGDIITQYFRLSQGGESGGPNAGAYIHGTIEALDGRIGTNSTNYWDIGNFTDYNLQRSAKMIGHGSSFIQLGDSSTWRLATNRIHTGWYEPTQDSYLHFPEFTFDGSSTAGNLRRWDYGIHVPTAHNDKFLYIRNASATGDLANLVRDLDDNATTHYWTYKFWIDGDGNVYAPNLYKWQNDSWVPVDAGGAVDSASKLSSYGGSSNRPVYFPNSGTGQGKPVQITVTDNSSATAVTSTDTNLITARTLYYAGYVKSSGVTSVTIAATSPVQSSTSTAQTGSSASTTISLASGYGDTQNPYTSKTKNYVLAAPSNAAGAPSFRALVAADIPDLSGTYLTSHQTVTNKGATLSWGSAVTVATIGSTDIKVSLPSNPDTNTTYTFANGTNGFTVTPSGGSAQTVTVTPSITNNVTGFGTSGSLVKWNGANTITNGPALGTDTTKFLNNKGEWAVPAGTYTYTLPLAANGTRGGVQIGYTQSGKNYPVQLSSEKMYVNVPWENTTYSAGTGISLSGTTFSNTGVLSITTTAGTHTVISASTGAISFNVPTKTSHLTNDSGFLTSHQTLYEEKIEWGPTSVSKAGSVSPIGMSLSNEHSCNRLAYINGDALVFEYSSNGGSTWTNYNYSKSDKSQFCTLSYGVPIGRASGSSNYTTSCQTRITLTAQNGTTGYVYTNPKKLLINISSSGSMQVLIEYRTGTNYQNNGSWTTFGTYNLSGWSGWNDIPLILGTLGGGTNQTSNNWQLRLTFIMTSVNSSYPTTAQVNSIRIFGENGWTVTSNMGSTGHLYSYDISQNATFPAQVTATKFSGNLTGNVTGNVSGSAGSVAWSGVTSKPTTLSGYGITDAKIASGVITLGSNTITPLTSATLVTGASNSKVNTAQSTNGNVYLNLVVNDNIQNAHNIVGSGTVTVTNDANGKITIAGSAHPTALKNPNALSIKVYNGTSTSSDTSYDGSTANQSVSVAGTSAITGISASAAAGGSTTFTLTKANGDTSTFDVTVTASVATGATKLTNSSGTAIDAGSANTPVYFSGGLPVALTSTTKIDYNLLPTGTTSSTVAIGNHTHTISLASDTGTTGVVNLSHGGKYKLTAGGSSVIFTLPSDNNTDTLVTQAYSTTNNSYPLLFTATAGITSTNSRGATTAILNNQIYANPNTGTITAVTFSGNATTATTASKLGSSTLGSSTKPIYLNSGTATECSTYAGGTKVTLNGDDKGASTASFYAPTSAGTANYVLISNGSGAPTWTAQSNITSGNSDENVKSTAVTAATTNYIVGSTTSTTTTGGLSKHASAIIYTTADSGTSGYTQLRLGNTTATSSAGGKEGQIRLYGTTATYYVDIKAGAPSANRTITLPNATGTVALTGSTTSSVATGITISDHSTTSVGSASGWNAGSASSWTFEDISCDDITSWDAGSGSASISGAVDSNDTSQLNITISHTHTAPSLAYTARIVSSKSGGSNGTAPSLTITSTPVVNGKSHTVTDPKHSHTNG